MAIMTRTRKQPSAIADHDLSTYAGRLGWAMKAAGQTQSAVARRVGMSHQAISHLCQPDKVAQGSVHTPRLALVLGVDPNWLATGRGIARPRDGKESSAPGQIPVLGELLGAPQGVEERHFATVTSAVQGSANDWDAYVLRVRGEVFHPRYRANEFIVVSPNSPPLVGHDVLVQTNDGRLTLKQLNWLRADELQLLSISGSTAPETLPMPEVSGIRSVWGSVGPLSFYDLTAEPAR